MPADRIDPSNTPALPAITPALPVTTTSESTETPINAAPLLKATLPEETANAQPAVLKITDTEPPIEAEATRLLRQHLPDLGNMGERLQQLKEMLSSYIGKQASGGSQTASIRKLYDAIEFILPERTPPGAAILRTLLQDSGIFYETKLAHAGIDKGRSPSEIADRDLKGLLLSVLEESKAADSGAELIGAIHGQLANVEAQQAANLLAQLNNGGLILQIPFFSGLHFATAALSVEPDGSGSNGGQKGERSESGYNLLFLLDLDRFGRTRIDAHVHERSVRVIFYIDQDPSVAAANEALPEFQIVLQALGYTEVLLAARPLKEMPEEKQRKFDSLTTGAPASVHILDTEA